MNPSFRYEVICASAFPMVGMVLLMFLLSSADQPTAVLGAVDDTALLMLPP